MQETETLAKFLQTYGGWALLIITVPFLLAVIRKLYLDTKTNYEERLKEQKLMDEQHLPIIQKQTDIMLKNEQGGTSARVVQGTKQGNLNDMFKAMKKEVKARNGKAKKVMYDNAVAWLRVRHALEEIEKLLDNMPGNGKKDTTTDTNAETYK